MKNNLFQSHFGKLKDSRSHINKLHDLTDVLLIVLVAVICGANTWKQMEEFGKAREKFLKTFLQLPNGIPSDDTFNRAISSIDTKEFEIYFIQWVESLPKSSLKQVIAIDGKTVRGVKSDGDKSPIHIVSA